MHLIFIRVGREVNSGLSIPFTTWDFGYVIHTNASFERSCSTKLLLVN